jgi:hypothetical protein
VETPGPVPIVDALPWNPEDTSRHEHPSFTSTPGAVQRASQPAHPSTAFACAPGALGLELSLSLFLRCFISGRPGGIAPPASSSSMPTEADPSQSLASAAAPVERLKPFGPPPLIEGDDRTAYDALLAHRGYLGSRYRRSIFRLRRLKVNLMGATAHPRACRR